MRASGLLLFTNDTAFADHVLRPESSIPKTYKVRARPALTDADLERLRQGVILEDGPTRPAGVKLLHRYKSYCVFELTIGEGRNRQVRRMVRAVGGKVDKLHRLRIGDLWLGALPRGEFRHLSAAEIEGLRGK
jgi:23S rRNA pseudouridine2605 synthase